MVSDHMVYVLTWTSWSSVFAGTVTAVALSVLMAVIGVALGFTVIRPKEDDPVAGLGFTFGLWAYISIMVSMAAGGFVSGLAAGRQGAEHGFLVWALTVVVGAFCSGIAMRTAVRALGSAVRGIGSGAAGMATAVGKGAVHAASGIVTELKENVKLHLDTEKLGENVSDVLRDTGIETLQPEYLQQQMREARSDLRTALHRLSLKPSDSEKIIAEFLDIEQTRLQKLTGDIDRESAVNALMRTRNIPQSEAQTMVDNAIRAYEHMVRKARESLHEVGAQVQDAKICLKELSDQAREKADRLSSSAARTALLAAAALLLAAVIGMGAGVWGAHTSCGPRHVIESGRIIH